VRRVYIYQWTAPPKNSTWDSALMDRRGKPRPAFKVLRTYVRRIRAAARRAARR
jgi:hypothetical protein